MTTIKLTVSGAKATAIVDGVLTSGSVGIPVTIEYDSIWDGLAKNLMCATGKWHPAGAPKAIINIDGSAAVAPEALIADNHLYLGVEGRNADGTLVICSTWADCWTVFAGADTNADPSVQPTAPVWAQLRAEIEQLKTPTVSDAQIETALDLYFERNPIKIPDGLENGCPLTTEQITTLDNMFKVCAFTKADVSAEYRSFCTAFGIEGGTVPDEPDSPAVTLTSISATYNGGKVSAGTPVNALSGIVVTARYSDGSTARVSGYTLSGTIKEGSNTITVTYQGKTATFTVYGEVVAEKTLESISATYSGGSVPVGTAVSALSGIVVTAHYSDGSTAPVSGYTLSGTIAEGSNTITVTYQGKTATFTVTGVAESGGGEETTTPFGVEWTEGYMLLNAEPYVNAKYVVSDYINVSGKTEIRIHYDGTGGKTINFQIESYDTAKKRLKDYSVNTYLKSESDPQYPSPLVYPIQTGTAYVRMATSIKNGSDSAGYVYYTDLTYELV